MPRLTRWALRLALLHLILGFSLGALMLCAKASGVCAWAWPLRGLHIELLTIGWTAQLALAVAYWILPRHPGGRRGPEAPAWAAWALLNLGVWVSGLTMALVGPRLLLGVGHSAEALGILVFAVQLWPRVKAFGV
ncbi:MAG TPA: hypothetical protein VLD63_00220 [Anaerolineales bacterium]|nr:hypothetical protein [Anaerolineales bacterium]